MTPIEITRRARSSVKELLEVPVEAIARCARDGEDWIVEVEVTETKAKLADNDVIARYQLRFDSNGEVASYERIARTLRAAG